jgi:CHASE2 domain-containing sensor protein
VGGRRRAKKRKQRGDPKSRVLPANVKSSGGVPAGAAVPPTSDRSTGDLKSGEGSGAAANGRNCDEPDSRPAEKETRSTILRDFVVGAVLIVVLLIGKIMFEDTTIGKRIEFTTYDWIHSLLSSEDPPVVVVDTTRAINRVHKGNLLADRKAIKDIIQLIAGDKDNKPAVIGVDVNFTAEYDSQGKLSFYGPDGEDPDLFDSCLKVRNDVRIPIFLGVHVADRTSPKLESELLVDPRYEKLAADISVDKADNRRMPLWFKWVNESNRIFTMGAALANAYRDPNAALAADHPELEVGTHAWPAWATESEFPCGDEKRTGFRDLECSEVLVDFSTIDRFQTLDLFDSAGAVNQKSFQEEKHYLRNKIVLLGAANPDLPKDRMFTVAGLSRQCYPGVYFHAAAAFTLATRPLRALTPRARLIVDLILAAAVLIAVAIFRKFCTDRSVIGRLFATHDPHRLPKLLTIIVIMLAFVFGVLIVNRTRVVWDDFLIVAFAMVLHLVLERPANRCWIEVSKALGRTRESVA